MSRVAPDDGREEKIVLELNALNCLVQARHGWFVANRNDHYLGHALIRYGEYNEAEAEFLRSLIGEGDGVIEVGANIGSHTIPLARRIGREGRLVAIEAQPAIHQYLCANIALNALLNVTTHACGCGAKRLTMRLPPIDYGSPTRQNFGGISLREGGEGTPVEVVPLDEVVDELPRFRLLKIDVEGMESDVIRGAARLIARYRPRLYVENDRVEKSEELITLILSLGYRLWWHAPPLFNPQNYFGVAENEYGNIVSLNMLGLPRDDKMEVPGLKEIVESVEHPLSG